MNAVCALFLWRIHHPQRHQNQPQRLREVKGIPVLWQLPGEATTPFAAIRQMHHSSSVPAWLPSDGGFIAPLGSSHSHYCREIKCNHIYTGFSSARKKPLSLGCPDVAFLPALPSHPAATADGHILPFVRSHSRKTSKKSLSKAPPGPSCSPRGAQDDSN